MPGLRLECRASTAQLLMCQTAHCTDSSLHCLETNYSCSWLPSRLICLHIFAACICHRRHAYHCLCDLMYSTPPAPDTDNHLRTQDCIAGDPCCPGAAAGLCLQAQGDGGRAGRGRWGSSGGLAAASRASARPSACGWLPGGLPACSCSSHSRQWECVRVAGERLPDSCHSCVLTRSTQTHLSAAVDIIMQLDCSETSPNG